MIAILFTSLFLSALDSSSLPNLDLSSPEALCNAYILFINSGAKFADYKPLVLTPDESYQWEMTYYKDKKRAEKYKKDQIALLGFWQKRWPELDYKKLLETRPLKYQSFSTKKKKSDSFYKEVTITVEDKNHKTHVFHLTYIGKINNAWKIFDLNHQPPIDEQ